VRELMTTTESDPERSRPGARAADDGKKISRCRNLWRVLDWPLLATAMAALALVALAAEISAPARAEDQHTPTGKPDERPEKKLEAAGWKICRTPDPLGTLLDSESLPTQSTGTSQVKLLLPKFHRADSALRSQSTGTFRSIEPRRMPMAWRALAPCAMGPHPETDRLEAKQLRLCLFKTGIEV